MKKNTTTAGKLMGTPVGTSGKTLYFGFNRLCDLEEQLDMSFGTILERLGRDLDLRTIRVSVALGLAEHHPEVNFDQMIGEVSVPVLAAALVAEMNATLAGDKARTGKAA